MPRVKRDVKTGRSSWRPAEKLSIRDKQDGMVYRWVDRTDAANIQKKLAEGWVPASSLHGTNAQHESPEVVGDGKPLTTLVEYRELQLMAMPADVAQDRNEYFQAQADEWEAAIKGKRLADDLRSVGARSHGKVIIE